MNTVSGHQYQPPVDRNMKVLERSFFITKIPLCIVQFADPKNISLFSKNFRESILRVPRIPHVVRLGQLGGSAPSAQGKSLACDNGIVVKGVLLNDSISSVEEASQKLSKDAQEFLRKTQAKIIPYEYVLDYDFWKAEEILRAVLPVEFLDEIPTGFTVTGHIAHLNLRQEFKPYSALIGQVILDKNGKIETVVDKVSSIATKFRTFPMKVIAGRDNDLIVTQKESNCSFKFDFSKVYWNSRLHTEHERLVKQYFQKGQVVCDVFAGVGPFAIPAGKKNVIVLANDLNPESFKYLKENIILNKTQKFVRPYNLDGAEFIKRSLSLLQNWRATEENATITVPVKTSNHRKKPKVEGQLQPLSQPQPLQIPIPFEISHFVMNLPDSSISFLNQFIGLFDGHPDILQMPWIHVHCFEKYGNDEDLSMEELHERVHKRITVELNTSNNVLPISDLSFHLVRKVSPTKPMFCVSFQLPRQVAFTSAI